ncbi:hypothetical protein [Spongiactinospora sp. TRM90649]|uniref:hypothetical protein n=1 Tax=Spongiactinospora sp. TRM90649 TaxID=3031114 RepID=UPI0023F89C7E|nr:hypothetical protein [Spongiactinospora sp. TRM90649]MDF5756254.1 hypothetical protein [Spongiactinospora sp. TRM90649]
MSRSLTIAIVALLVAVGLTPPPAGATAGPDAVTAAAGIIRTAVEQESGGEDGGFGGIVVTAQSVRLYWKGVPPIGAALDRARRVAPVEVSPAAHSLAELRSQAEIIARAIQANPEGPVIGVRLAPDSSGLVLWIRKDADPADLGTPEIGVPYTTEVSDVPTLTSRQADTPPFSGGAVLSNDDPGLPLPRCTSGFPVAKNGRTFLLTAGHCGRVGGGWHNGDNRRVVGVAEEKSAPHDLLLIQSSGAATVYVGVGADTKAGVAGWDYVYPGEVVESSGAASRGIADLRVTGHVYAAVLTDNYGGSTYVTNLVDAVRISGRAAAMPGDSGGPVHTTSGGKVIAKGSVSAVNGSHLLFQPITSAFTDFGVTLLVN